VVSIYCFVDGIGKFSLEQRSAIPKLKLTILEYDMDLFNDLLGKKPATSIQILIQSILAKLLGIKYVEVNDKSFFKEAYKLPNEATARTSDVRIEVY
jgi:hypothetical protein